VKNKLKKFSARPPGASSRLRKASGPKSTWIAPNGQSVELPVEVDLVKVDEVSEEVQWGFLARVDLVGSKPAIASLEAHGFPALAPSYLQLYFRWQTPLDIVLIAVPEIMSQGIDPYAYDYAPDGYPDAADINPAPNKRLSDEFLEQVATQYQQIGRGYAREIALQRGVSRRTAVSWIEKARKRGILPPTMPGKPSF